MNYNNPYGNDMNNQWNNGNFQGNDLYNMNSNPNPYQSQGMQPGMGYMPEQTLGNVPTMYPQEFPYNPQQAMGYQQQPVFDGMMGYQQPQQFNGSYGFQANPGEMSNNSYSQFQPQNDPFTQGYMNPSMGNVYEQQPAMSQTPYQEPIQPIMPDTQYPYQESVQSVMPMQEVQYPYQEPVQPVMQQVQYANSQDASTFAPMGNAIDPFQPPMEHRSIRCVSGVHEGEVYSLDKPVVMGRKEFDCSVLFPKESAGISRRHCMIVENEMDTSCVIIQDLQSSYGTLVNEVDRLTNGASMDLKIGDTFTLGENETFVIE